MSRDSLCRLTAASLAELIRQRETSPVEAVEALLERIQRLNPHLVVYATVAADRALAEARAAEVRLGQEDLGPLHGVPISVKDSIWVRGVRTTWGSVLFEDFVPIESAVAVERLEAAGAIVIGKTNIPELSHKGFTTNRLFGVTRNPWDLSRTPGGSTGGGASAVAAGLGPIALGTDAGGSIRRPASHTGVVGFKPSQGRIPLGPGFPHDTPGYVVYGPLARTVEDAALAFACMAGPHPCDRESFLPSLPKLTNLLSPGDLAGCRVAWSADFGGQAVDPGVRAICESAVADFETIGCNVEHADPPIPADFEDDVTGALGGPAVAEILAPHLAARRHDIDPTLVAQAERGESMSGRQVYLARECQIKLYQDLRHFFDRYDLLVTPTAAALPWPVEREYPAQIDGREVGPRGHAVFTPFANHAGLPAISVPAGWTDAGLPVGLQIAGPYLADGLVLRTAGAFEQCRPWADRWPPDAESA